MNPTSVSSHRAFMVLAATLVACLIFGLTAGWQWYFRETGIRNRMIALEEASRAERSAPVPVPSFTPPASPSSASGDATAPVRTETSPSRLTLNQVQPNRAQGQSGSSRIPGTASVEMVPKSESSGDLAEAERLLETYSRISDWHDRVSFVWNPDRVRPLMEDFYESQGGVDPVRGRLNSSGKFLLDGMEILHFSYSGNRPLGNLELAFRRNANGNWALDWESFVGYSEMRWSEFRRNRVTRPILLRAFAKLADYYNFEFSDEERFLSVRLMSEDGEQLLYGFCERGTELATYLISELGIGTAGAKGFTVRAAFPKDSESDDCVWLTEVVSPRWLLGENQQ